MPQYSSTSSRRGHADAIHDELPSGLVSLTTLEHEFESLRTRADQLDSELDQWRHRMVDRSAPPSIRRTWVRTLVERFGVSERTACRLLQQHRSTQRYRSPDQYRAKMQRITTPHHGSSAPGRNGVQSPLDRPIPGRSSGVGAVPAAANVARRRASAVRSP